MMGDVFKALSDPTRRKILELLKEKPMNAGEIADCFKMSKPSVSNHLKILKNCGLVIDERNGQNIIYHLNSTILQDMIKWFYKFNGDNENEK